MSQGVQDAGVIVQFAIGVLTLAGLLWAVSGGRRWWAERREHRAFWRQFRADWTGTAARPGFPAQPGVMQSLLEIRGDWQAMQRRVRRIEEQIINLRQQLIGLHNRMEHVEKGAVLPDAEDAEG